MTGHAKVTVVLTVEFYVPDTEAEISALNEVALGAWRRYQPELCRAGVAMLSAAAVVANGGTALTAMPSRPLVVNIECFSELVGDDEYRIAKGSAVETVRVSDDGVTVHQHPVGHA